MIPLHERTLGKHSLVQLNDNVNTLPGVSVLKTCVIALTKTSSLQKSGEEMIFVYIHACNIHLL